MLVQSKVLYLWHQSSLPSYNSFQYLTFKMIPPPSLCINISLVIYYIKFSRPFYLIVHKMNEKFLPFHLKEGYNFSISVTTFNYGTDTTYATNPVPFCEHFKSKVAIIQLLSYVSCLIMFPRLKQDSERYQKFCC